ncbi:MAG: hypothetical protein GF335_04920 [Candidatus Moranbacteria bacterium]|nr:hypothetical protein [Candidatus Moranbacteria bacterium]
MELKDLESAIAKFDKFDLRTTIEQTYKQFKKAIKEAGDAKTHRSDYDSLVLCGMGGSAMPGYLLDLIDNLDIPVFIHRNYGVKKKLTQNPLFIVSSFSGNTEETLKAYEEAKKSSYDLICFSNGGKLMEKCQKDNFQSIFYNVLQENFQPRFALPLAFACMFQVLENSGIIKDDENSLIKTAEFLKNLDQKEIQKHCFGIALEIKNTTAIFYCPYHFRYLAMINKIKINENSKLPAFWNFYPELNHNEMNGFENGQPGNFKLVSFQDNDYGAFDEQKNLKRAQITNNLLTKFKYNVIVQEIEGKNQLEKIFYTLHLGDWISYYLAILNNQDPTPVNLVEAFKKELK